MSEIADLLEELDMESWLDYEGIRYKLTRGTRGLQANIRECPACGNSKWKVYFGVETGFGNCFVCGETFNKWRFISKHLNTSNTDTYTYLRDFMTKQGWKPKVEVKAPVDLPTLNLPPSFPLPIKGKNLAYLQGRGIGLDIAQFFHLHYCHSGQFEYLNAEGEKESQDYSKRVIIPVFDMDGNLVSFQGRDITGAAERKYLFPPGFAATGSVIYNAHNAKKSARIVMGEGAFDAWAIKIAMDQDPALREGTACASFGKKLSFDQLQKLAWLKENANLKEVVFMWDSEREAVRAAVIAGLECTRRGIVAKLALLPPGKDPNEVPAEVVRKAIWEAKTITPLSAIAMNLEARKLD